MLSTGLPGTYLQVFSNLLLKLEVFSLLKISGLKEFQFATVCGNCGRKEGVTIARSSVASRHLKVVWQDDDFMV